MRVCLLSAYHADSHARWARGWQTYLDAETRVLTLAPRWFAWRTGSASLTWATEHRADLLWADVIVATSITDVAALRGLVPELAHTPIALYYHENQFAYPTRPGESRDARLLMQSVLSALAADALVFNSAFNRDSFILGAQAFLDGMPDHTARIQETLLERSRVLPVGLEESCFQAAERNEPCVIWNHRWEWDKAPERLFQALTVLRARGCTPKLVIAGPRFRQVPDAITSGLVEFADQIVASEFLDAIGYRERLTRCTHVVSTALHEFQGLAVLEACAAGCVPVVPDRLAYPEFFDACYRYASHPDDSQAEAHALADHLQAALGSDAPPDVSHLSWPALRPAYQAMLNDLVRA